MAIVDFRKVLRDEGVNRAGITSQLLTRQLGVSLSDKVIGYKDSSGVMSWYIPEGGDAIYNSLQLSGLTGSGPIIADADGNLTVGSSTSGNKSVLSNTWVYSDTTPTNTEFTVSGGTITINKTSTNGLMDYLFKVLFEGSSITLQNEDNANEFQTIQLTDVATVAGDNYSFPYLVLNESAGFSGYTLSDSYLMIFDIVATQVFDGNNYSVMVNDGAGGIYGTSALEVRSDGGFANLPRITNNGRVDIYSTDGDGYFDAKLHGYSQDGSPYIHFSEGSNGDSQEINFGLNAFNITTHGNTNIELRPAKTIQIRMNNDDLDANTAPKMHIDRHDGSTVFETYDKTYANWIEGLLYAPLTTSANIDSSTRDDVLVTKEWVGSKLYDTNILVGDNSTEDVSVNHVLSHIWSSTTAPDEGFDLSQNGDGTFDLTSGDVYIKNGATDSLDYYSVGAVSNISIQDDATSYIFVHLVGGVPTVDYTTDLNIITQIGNAFLYVISRVGTELNVMDIRGLYDGFMANYARYNVTVDGFDKASGASLSVDGTHHIALTDGLFYTLNLPFTTPAINTAVSDTFTYAYSNGSGGWTRVPSSTVINFDAYDNGTGTLGIVANNKYGIHWLYVIHNNPSHYLVQYGVDEYDNLEDALAAGLPNRPPEVAAYSTGDAIWKIIYTGDGTLRDIVDLHLSPVGNSVTISDHNELTGLQGGTANEYYHLTSEEYSNLGSQGTGTLNISNGTGGWTDTDMDYSSSSLYVRNPSDFGDFVSVSPDWVRFNTIGTTLGEVTLRQHQTSGELLIETASSTYTPVSDDSLVNKLYVDNQVLSTDASIRSFALGITTGDDEYITEFPNTIDWSLNAITIYPTDTLPGNYLNNARITVSYNDTSETAIVDNNRNDIRVVYEQRPWDDTTQSNASWHIETGNNTTQTTLKEVFIVFDVPPTGEEVYVKVENCGWAGNPYELLLSNITDRVAYDRDSNLIATINDIELGGPIYHCSSEADVLYALADTSSLRKTIMIGGGSSTLAINNASVVGLNYIYGSPIRFKGTFTGTGSPQIRVYSIYDAGVDTLVLDNLDVYVRTADGSTLTVNQTVDEKFYYEEDSTNNGIGGTAVEVSLWDNTLQADITKGAGYFQTGADDGTFISSYMNLFSSTSATEQWVSYANDFTIFGGESNEHDISITGHTVTIGNDAIGQAIVFENNHGDAGSNTLKAPNLTSARISAGGDQSLVTKKYVDDTVAGGGAKPSMTLTFGADASLTTNQIISPVAGEGTWSTNKMGVPVPNGYEIVEVSALINRFVTNATASISVQLRAVDANGTLTGQINGNSGTLVATMNISGIPNTSGATRYYFKKDGTFSASVGNDKMLIAVISSQSVQSADGLVLQVKVRQI